MHVSQIHLACQCSQLWFSGPLLQFPMRHHSFHFSSPPSASTCHSALHAFPQAQHRPCHPQWPEQRTGCNFYADLPECSSGRGAEVKCWLLTVTGENVVRDHGHNSLDIYRHPCPPSLCQCPWSSGHCLALVFAPTAQPKTCFSTSSLSDLIPGWWAVGISTAFRRNPAPSSGRWCCSVVLCISQSPPEKQNL